MKIMVANKVIALFNVDFKLEEVFENMTSFRTKFTSSNISVPEVVDLKSALTSIPSRDRFTVTIAFDFGDIESLYSIEQTDSFLHSLSKKVKDKDQDENVSFEIQIEKQCVDHTISIYSFNQITEFLKALSFEELLNAFKITLGKGCFKIQVMQDNFLPFQTKTLLFESKISDNHPSISTIERNVKLNRIKTVTHFGGSSQYDFLPEDFDIVERNDQYSEFNGILDRLCLVYCLISMFDIVSNEREGIFYKLNGYKSYQGNLFFNKLDISSLEEYLKIYYWIYEGGNLSDKIGLARNIISIHLDKDNITLLMGNPFHSIKSGYEIYLKQNIRQYIEIRNKISDQLLDFNKRANTIVDSFAGGFQKNSFALITTFSSLLIIRFLSSNSSSSKVFVLNATILSYSFIIISIIYLYISLKDVKSQKCRFNNSYANLKKRYTDLLTTDDIQKILNNDKDFNDDMSYIETKTKWYTIQWIVVIILIAFLVIFFFFSYSFY